MAQTTREVTVTYLANIGFPTEVTIPADSAVIRVDQQWAVASVPLLVKLTGNSHDPKYRYCMVPSEAVAE